MPVSKRRRSLSPALMALAAAGLFLASPRHANAQAFLRLSKPPAPEGSARTIAMGTAVVALGGDAGAVAVNPATIVSAGADGGNDFTIGGGDRGMDLFAAHIYGNKGDGIPGAVWGAVLNGPAAQETLGAYTVAGSTRTGLDIGATLRYEQWKRNGVYGHLLNGDIGLRYIWTPAVSLGLSALSLAHTDPFRGTNTLPTDPQAIAAIGYTGLTNASLELELVYTSSHRYGRFGGEYRVTPNSSFRVGISDRDYSVGVGYKQGSVNGSLSAVIFDRERPLYSAGLSSQF